MKEEVGVQVVRTQWIDYRQSGIDLVNKKILIVDEVDDTRTTLHYAVSELKKDVVEQCKAANADPNNTEFGVFVLHDKLKPKKADLPAEIMDTGRYIAARQLPDYWIAYPWESTDIVHHTRRAIEQGNDVFLPWKRQFCTLSLWFCMCVLFLFCSIFIPSFSFPYFLHN